MKHKIGDFWLIVYQPSVIYDTSIKGPTTNENNRSKIARFKINALGIVLNCRSFSITNIVNKFSETPIKMRIGGTIWPISFDVEVWDSGLSDMIWSYDKQVIKKVHQANWAK